MADDVKFSVGLEINPQSLRNIKKQIENELRAAGVNITPKIDGTKVSTALASTFGSAPAERLQGQKQILNKLNQETQNLQSAMSKQAVKLIDGTSRLDRLNAELEGLLDAADSTAQQVRSLEKQIKKTETSIDSDKKEFDRLKSQIADSRKAFDVLKSVVGRTNIEIAERFKKFIPEEIAASAIAAGQSLQKALAQFDKLAGQIAVEAQEIARLTIDDPTKIQSSLDALNSVIVRARLKVEASFKKLSSDVAEESLKKLESSRKEEERVLKDKIKIAKKESDAIDNLRRFREQQAALIQEETSKILQRAADKKSKSIDDIRNKRLKEASLIEQETAKEFEAETKKRFRLAKEESDAIDRVRNERLKQAQAIKEETDRELQREADRRFIKLDKERVARLAEAAAIENERLKEEKAALAGARKASEAIDRTRNSRVKEAVAIEKERIAEENARKDVAAARIKEAQAIREETDRILRQDENKRIRAEEKRKSDATREAEAIRKETNREIEQDLVLAKKEGDLRRRIISIQEQSEALERQKLRAINQQLQEQNIKGKGKRAIQLTSLAQAPGIVSALPSDQAQKFIRIIRQQDEAFKKLNVTMRSHNGSIAKGTALVDRLTGSMRSGTKAAFQFGFAASDAASRLLAWAAPSTFLFRAVIALQEAARTLEDVDTAARRLAFFQTSSRGLEGGVATFDRATSLIREKVGANITGLIEEAQRSGLAVKAIQDAALAAEKVGTAAFEGGVATPFLKAVEAIKLIEGESANTDDIVEGLFQTIRQSSPDADTLARSLENSAVFAANLAREAANARFNFNDFVSVVNRALPSFIALQGADFTEVTRFAATISSIAGTRNASQLGTLLKTLSSVSVQFGKEIEKRSGIEIINEDGLISGIDGFQELLKAIKDLGRTEAARQLADLGVDRDQIAGIFSMANAYSQLKTELDDVRKSTKDGSRAIEELTVLSGGAQVVAEGTDASFRRFRTSLVALADSQGINDLRKSILDFGTQSVNSLSAVIRLVSQLSESSNVLKGILTALAGVGIAKALQFGGTALTGFVAGTLGAQVSEQSRQILLSTSKKEASTQQQIAVAKREGAISSRVALQFEKELLKISIEENAIVSRKQALQSQLNILKKSEVSSAAEMEAIQRKINLLELDEERTLSRELAIRRQISAEASKTIIGGFSGAARRQVGAAIGGVAVTAGLLFSEPIGRKVGEKFGTAVGEGVESGISGGTLGGTLGAAIGSAIAPGLGTAIGAVLGAAISGIASGFSTFESATDRIAKEAKDRAQQLATIEKAAAFERERINAAALEELKTIDNQNKAKLHSIELTKELELLAVDIQEAESKGLQTETLIARQRQKRIALQQTLSSLGEIERFNASETARFEKEIVKAKAESERLSRGIALSQRVAIEQLKQQTQSEFAIEELKISFDRQQIQNELNSLNSQLGAKKDRIQLLEDIGGSSASVVALKEEVEKITEQIATTTQKGIELGADAIIRLQSAAQKDSQRLISAWSGAAKEFVDRFKDIFEIQKKISENLDKESEIRIQIIDLEDFRKKTANSIRFGIDRSIQDIKDALTASLEIIPAKLDETISNFDLQRQSLLRAIPVRGDLTPAGPFAEGPLRGPSLAVQRITNAIGDAIENSIGGNFDFGSDIGGVLIGEISKISAELVRVLSDTSDVASEESQFRKFAIEELVNEANVRAEIAQDVVDLEIKRVQAKAQSERDLINVLQDRANAEKNIIAIEAERAKRLIDDPQTAIKEIRDVISARGIFRNAANVEDPEVAARLISDRIKQLQGKLNFAGIQKLTQGIEAAVQQNIRLSKAFSPEEFRNIALATLGGRGAKTQEAVANIANIDEKISESINKIAGAAGDEKALVKIQTEIQEAVRQLKDARAVGAENQQISIQENLTNALLISSRANESLALLGPALANVAPNLSNVLTNSQYSDGVTRIVDAISRLTVLPQLPLLQDPQQVSAGAQKETTSATKQFANEQAASISKIGEGIINLNESLNQLKSINQEASQRSSEPTKLEIKVPDLQLSPDVARELVDRLVEAQATSLDRTVLALKPVSEKIEELINKGISVNGSNILVEVQAKLDQTINASEELNALFLEIAGGNRAEAERLKTIVLKLLRKESERDPSAVSVFDIESLTSQPFIGPTRQ